MFQMVMYSFNKELYPRETAAHAKIIKVVQVKRAKMRFSSSCRLESYSTSITQQSKSDTNIIDRYHLVRIQVLEAHLSLIIGELHIASN